MKKKIISAVGVGLTVLGLYMQQAHGATDDQIEYCDAIGGLAFTLMNAHQQGLDKEMFLNHPATTAMSAALIERAWQEPFVEAGEIENRSLDFQNEIKQKCLVSISI